MAVSLLYQLYDVKRGADHIYTINPMEVEAAQSHGVDFTGYAYGGISGRVFNDHPPGAVPVFRLYQPELGDQLYTSNPIERWTAIHNLLYRDEGVAFYLYPTYFHGTAPLFRLYRSGYVQPYAIGHFYTTSWPEAELAVRAFSYILEEIVGYMFR